ncbi:DUF805 domain-containing protein [Butyrivibrio proteoclasticus]|uniref:DUF805 domain-containing protein n=1 Tax=Butyrivibrio proteoclasticus TaxID=43305 RepID=UPI0006874E97|nr:DUF805 domain-containing protein [Butyrivibrio proteoclasticus]
MNFGQAIKSCFSNYANFKGRARRSEFWFFFLFCYVCSLALNMITSFATSAMSMQWVDSYGDFNFSILGVYGIQYLLGLLLTLPQYAVMVRRLHDTGRSGALALVKFIMDVAIMVLAIIMIVSCFSLVIATVAKGYDYEPDDAALAGLGFLIIIIMLLALAALVIDIILLIFLCQDSQYFDNKYGECPKKIIMGYDPSGAPIYGYPTYGQSYASNPYTAGGYNQVNRQMQGQPVYQQPVQPVYQQPVQPAQPVYQQPVQPAQPVNQTPVQPAAPAANPNGGQFSGVSIENMTNEDSISPEAKKDPEDQHFDSSVYQDDNSLWK